MAGIKVKLYNESCWNSNLSDSSTDGIICVSEIFGDKYYVAEFVSKMDGKYFGVKCKQEQIGAWRRDLQYTSRR